MVIRTLKNITGEEKKEIATFIKEQMKNIEFYTVDIIYNAYTGIFKVINLEESLNYILNDNVFYNSFRNFGLKEMTLKEIEEAIFKA